MLEAKTKEQQEHITEIVEKYFPKGKASPRGYGDNEEVTIYVPYDDGYDEECIDIPFDMMAEITDYLRSQNNK
jgi:hypothetical protein